MDIIAFKGLDNQFDHKAFDVYVKNNNGCKHVFGWQETNKALSFIKRHTKAYQLYGYSKGAESVKIILEKTNRLPVCVVTIGAWKSIDLDFRKYQIPFENYFDSSGKGQTSPGWYLNADHSMMQAEVNNHYPCQWNGSRSSKPAI